MLFRSNDTATTEIYTVTNTLSLHDALPLWELELANPDVNPNYIQVNQILNIPAPGQLTMPPASPSATAT